LRKGLFFLLLGSCVAVLVVAVLLAHIVFGPGRIYRPVKQTLSFKPFTLHELLSLDIEIDPKTCGKKIRSPELEKIEERTAKVRKLPLRKPIEFRSCSEDIIRAELNQAMVEDTPPEEMDADQKLLAALGLIPPKENLSETLSNVLTEQISGAYDTETKDITIVEGKGLGSIMDELTMAHEITHGLQDQNFYLDKPPMENDAYNGDNDFAVESLVEGDAMVTMLDYAGEYVDVEKLLEAELEGSEMSSKELDKAPAYIRDTLLFPYEEGMNFAEQVKNKKGLAGVDAAYRDPPLSTEQIIHPDKYITHRDNPRPVPLPDISGALGPKWKLINSDTMGEFDVRAWFDQYGGLITGRDVAGGWGGNTIQYYQGPGKKYVVVNMFAWDTAKDAGEFFKEYSGLLKERFENKVDKTSGDGDWYLYKADGGLFYCGITGDATLCVQAPDHKTLQKVLSNYPQFQRPT
jgi:hypothetical protein